MAPRNGARYLSIPVFTPPCQAGPASSRRIAKSLFPCPDEVERLAEVAAQVVGASPDRKIFLHPREQPQRGQGRVSEHGQAFRQTRATTPLPILVPPPILEE